MDTINFKTESLMKKFKKALNASNHIRSGELVRVTTGGNHKIPFPRNQVVTNYIELISSEIFKIPIIHNNFTKDEITENILFVLEDLKINNALSSSNLKFKEIYDESITNFENGLKETIKKNFDEFICIFHVDNLELHNPIDFGKVILFQFDGHQKYEAINDKLIGENFFKVGETYAKTKIYGSKEYALAQSQVNIKIALNMLKLLLPEHYCNFNLDGDVLIPNYRQHLILGSNEKLFSGWEIQNSSFKCNFEEEVGDVNYELHVLSILLMSNPKLEFENRLLTAIYWFGEALSVKRNQYSKIEKKHPTQLSNLEFFDIYPKLLNLVICLETLFVYDDENKSEAISSKVANLIANPGAQETIKSFLSNIYGYRSKIVHAGNIYVSKHDINLLMDYTRISLFYMISINYLYSDKMRYFDKMLGNL